MKSIRPRKLLSIPKAVLVLIALLYAVPGCPQVQFGPAILRVGTWLGEQILVYFGGKAVDKALGYDYEEELASIEASLQAQLQKGSRDNHKLRVELEATRSQLAMLRMLIYSAPNAQELEVFKNKLASDIEKVRAVQQAHEDRLDQHDAAIDQHDKRIGDLERQLTELVARLREPGGRADSTIVPPPDREARQASVAIERSEQGTNRGVPLVVNIQGDANNVTVREVASVADADVGTFSIRASHGAYSFSLVAGAGSVVMLTGDANTVTVDSTLCGRVRVVRAGNRNEVSGCK